MYTVDLFTNSCFPVLPLLFWAQASAFGPPASLHGPSQLPPQPAGAPWTLLLSAIKMTLICSLPPSLSLALLANLIVTVQTVAQ